MQKFSKAKHQQLALFFVEGDSEEVFYRKLFTKRLNGIAKVIKNVEGLYNIQKTVIGKSIEFSRKHPGSYIRIYCCIDRESRDRAPEIDIDELKKTILSEKSLKKVLSADLIVATQMLESWFFYDIEGIYKYLKIPVKHRNTTKYLPIEKNRWQDLSKLFEQADKIYLKGQKSENFIDNLDLDKIYNRCAELQAGINLVIANNKNYKNKM